MDKQESRAGRKTQLPSLGGLTRRDLLKLAGGALAAGAVPGGAWEPPRPQTKRPKKVIVGGGGIGGLCCGYELMKRGHEVVVLEAAGHAGGHVRTLHDPFADGLYADVGAEHITLPGYDLYWGYVKEFNLTALPYPHRDHLVRSIHGKLYSEEQLHDRSVLAGCGLNPREINYLAAHPWYDFLLLYINPYLDHFHDEYRPFDAGLDDLDHLTLTQLLRKEGASPAAIGFLGNSSSALHTVWHAAILKLRGVPWYPPKVFRIKGGNQVMTDTFAARLGERVHLGCPITGIEHGATGVRVHCREFAQKKTYEGDSLVCSMSAIMLRQIPVQPGWPPEKGFAVRNVPYYTQARFALQSRTAFWEKDGVSINLELEAQACSQVWRMAEEVPTPRAIVVGSAAPLTTGAEALASFRQQYPGKSEDIEQVVLKDWSKDPWAMACETVTFRPGQLPKFWPATREPVGRIHFAGAYTDNLNWGMEAATRSANRVAKAIDEA